MSRRLLPLVAVLAGALLLGFALSSLGLAVNRSPSLPRGLYRITHEPVEPHRLVLVCLPAKLAAFALARSYLPPGPCPAGTMPLGKIVLAAAGQEVRVADEGLAVDGASVLRSRPAPRDGAGRPLAAFPAGVYRVRRGEVWLFSPYHRLAWDSRYYGPLPTSTVLATVQPLLLFEHPPAPAGFRLRCFTSRTH